MTAVLSFLFKREPQRDLSDRPSLSTDYLGLKTLTLPPEKDEDSIMSLVRFTFFIADTTAFTALTSAWLRKAGSFLRFKSNRAYTPRQLSTTLAYKQI
jgi:hypothetical protein